MKRLALLLGGALSALSLDGLARGTGSEKSDISGLLIEIHEQESRLKQLDHEIKAETNQGEALRRGHLDGAIEEEDIVISLGEALTSIVLEINEVNKEIAEVRAEISALNDINSP